MSCLFVLIKNLYPSQITSYKIERKKGPVAEDRSFFVIHIRIVMRYAF